MIRSTGLLSKPRTHAGFTLIEMVVSLSVISIIFLAMGSVMLLAAQSIPTEDDAPALTSDALEVTRQLASELETATTIAHMTDRVIMFKIPDRNGDGNDEMLAYSWSGTPGAPLFRNYNGGTAVTVLPSVQSFSLTYDIRSAPQPAILEESEEILLDSFNSGILHNEFPITQYNWMGQLITPANLPNEALDWNVSRVLFQATKHSSDTGITKIQLRPVDESGMPTSTVLQTRYLYENVLDSNYLWIEANFNMVRGLSPSEKLSLVLAWQAGDESAGIRYSTINGSGRLFSYTKGASWSYGATSSMTYYVFGTYTREVSQPPIDVLGSVTVKINSDTGPATEVRSQVSLLNRPEVP
tara:strand:- start:232 stop:1296 length:1065 start_codon:yes stop_codon:yes gene_type:complete